MKTSLLLTGCSKGTQEGRPAGKLARFAASGGSSPPSLHSRCRCRGDMHHEAPKSARPHSQPVQAKQAPSRLTQLFLPRDQDNRSDKKLRIGKAQDNAWLSSVRAMGPAMSPLAAQPSAARPAPVTTPPPPPASSSHSTVRLQPGDEELLCKNFRHHSSLKDHCAVDRKKLTKLLMNNIRFQNSGPSCPPTCTNL